MQGGEGIRACTPDEDFDLGMDIEMPNFFLERGVGVSS